MDVGAGRLAERVGVDRRRLADVRREAHGRGADLLELGVEVETAVDRRRGRAVPVGPPAGGPFALLGCGAVLLVVGHGAARAQEHASGRVAYRGRHDQPWLAKALAEEVAGGLGARSHDERRAPRRSSSGRGNSPRKERPPHARSRWRTPPWRARALPLGSARRCSSEASAARHHLLRAIPFSDE